MDVRARLLRALMLGRVSSVEICLLDWLVRDWSSDSTLR